MRGTVLFCSPALDQRLPLGAAGLYIVGCKTGASAYECPIAQELLPYPAVPIMPSWDISAPI